MRIILLFSLIAVPFFSLQAKPSQPLDTMLFIDSHKEVGDKIDYHVTFKCQPWLKIDKVIFKLKLPKDYTLEEGFSYWEGEIKAKSMFTRTFIIRGPNKGKGEFFINATLEMENNKGFKSTKIDLTKENAVSRSKVIDVKFGNGGDRKGRNRNGSISRQ